MSTRTSIPALIAALAGLFFLGCGGTGSALTADQPLPAGADCTPHAHPSLYSAIAEVEAAPVPPGIDAKIFAELRAELLRILRATAVTKGATPRSANETKVTSLVVRGNYIKGWWLEWDYRNAGDYDLNSEVNVADLTQVGMFFGRTYEDADWAAAVAADGNGNGIIDVGDLAPIGRNYYSRVCRYDVYSGSGDTLLPPDGLLASVAFSDGIPGDAGKICFKLDFSAPIEISTFCVQPYDGAVGGTPSNLAQRTNTNDWHMFGHDRRHSRRSPYLAAQTNELRWSYRLGAVSYASPAIAPDGTVYIGCYDHNLYAFTPSGEVKWLFEAQERINSTPAIGADGSIYFGSRDGNIYALNSDGSLKWSYPTGENVKTSPAIDRDGNIYLGSWDNNFYAFEPDGTLKWIYPTEGWIRSSAAVGDDGTIYVGSEDHNLHAINPDGSRRWTFETDDSVNSSPAIAENGTIYVGSSDYNLYAVNPDGSGKWAFPTEYSVVSSPAIAEDGTIYVGSNDNHFYAVHPDGSLYWRFTANDLVGSSPSIGADGTVYVGSHDGNLYAFHPDGRLKWKYETGKWIMSSPALAMDGTVYVSGYSHMMYAFGQ